MSDRPSKALSTMLAGGAALLPIYPKTFEDVVRLARMAIISGMVKPQQIGWGDDKETERPEATEARATMIIMQGMEIGLPPMQAVQLIAMINGRMTVHSEGVPSTLLSKGFKIKQEFVGVPYEDTFKAVCTLTRPDGQVFVGEFSVSDAKEAGLWSDQPKIKRKTRNGFYEADNDSAWYRYKKRMLWARALGFATKDGGADAMRGLMIREEVEDMIRSGEIVDITPVPIAKTRAAIASVPMDDAGVPEMDEPEAQKVPADESSDITDVPDDQLSAVEEARALAELREAIDGADSPGIRMEIVEGYESLIDRMSPAGRRAAEKIIEGRE